MAAAGGPYRVFQAALVIAREDPKSAGLENDWQAFNLASESGQCTVIQIKLEIALSHPIKDKARHTFRVRLVMKRSATRYDS